MKASGKLNWNFNKSIQVGCCLFATVCFHMNVFIFIIVFSFYFSFCFSSKSSFVSPFDKTWLYKSIFTDVRNPIQQICMCACERDDFVTWVYASSSANRAVNQASPSQRPRPQILVFANSRWHMQNICKGNGIIKWRVKGEKIAIKNVDVIVLFMVSLINYIGSNVAILKWNAKEIKKLWKEFVETWKSILYIIHMVTPSKIV